MGRIQHLSIYDVQFIRFLEKVFRDSTADEPIYYGSPSVFRRRWDRILKVLAIDGHVHLTPGGVRGGGAVFAFETGTALPLLLWRMRLKHMATVEHYLQEVSASMVVPELPAHSRHRIRMFADFYQVLLT